jgi:hypothetical protein
MIISHKNKLVFFKPMKVAGSSVEVALSRHCGDEDILTGTNHIEEVISEKYDYPTRNNIVKHRLKNEVALSALSKSGNIHKVTPEMIKSGVFVEVIEPMFHMHSPPCQVFKRCKADISDYRSVTIVRNPWDMIVSFFWWSFYTSPSGYIDSMGVVHSNNISSRFSQSSHPEVAPTLLDDESSLRTKMEIFLQLSGNFNGPFGIERNKNVLEWFIQMNERFYEIDHDYILKYENLQKDYDGLCDFLSFERSTLPRLKTSQRKLKIPYQEYFNDWSLSYVSDRLSTWKDNFNYCF